MADFHQNGSVATLHNLCDRPISELETELKEFAKTRPMGLILPSLYSEIQTKALPKIIEELKGVEYLDNIVIGPVFPRDHLRYMDGFRFLAPVHG